VTTCPAATLALLRVRHAPSRRRLPVASRRPFMSRTAITSLATVCPGSNS
jgi:hypothetical protein